MRYFIPLLTLLIPLLLSAQDGEFDAYYPENQLYSKLGVKELSKTTIYKSNTKYFDTITFDKLGRITSTKSGNDTQTTYFVYEKRNDTLIKISYRGSTDKDPVDTFKIELFIYNKNGTITNYYNFNNQDYVNYASGTNCTDGFLLAHLSSTFYNENFVYNEKGKCIYVHYSKNSWVEVPFKVTTPLPYETLEFNYTYKFQYNDNGNLFTKTGIAGEYAIGKVDTFFYQNKQLILKHTHKKTAPLSNINFIITTYTKTIEQNLSVITIEEVATNSNLNFYPYKIEPITTKYRYFYNAQGLLVRVEKSGKESNYVEDYEYRFY